MTHEEDCLGGICDCDNPIPISRPVTPHDELLAKVETDQEITKYLDKGLVNGDITINAARQHWFQSNALRAVVELHKPFMGNTLELCKECNQARRVDDPVITYPCRTIQAIEQELS